MGHPGLENKTLFVCEPLFLTDEDGNPLLVVVIKATYAIIENSRLMLADEQIAVNMGGEHWGDPDTTSYKYEPETAFAKPATDVVLIGHAYAPEPMAVTANVLLKVGPVMKLINVTGDRYWTKAFGIVSMTKPKPFEKIPLVYENAFGGWDRSHPDPEKHSFDPRNPVGTGFNYKHGKFVDGIKLPNLEDPKNPINNFRDRPQPAGFGFISPNWQPRASFAGTYDEAWMKQRMPLLPKDFNKSFFNAAHPDLIAPGFLNGNEPVLIVNASPNGRISFNLPGNPPPMCLIQLRDRKSEELRTNLDTVIINTDENLIFLIWRAGLLLRNGPQDIVSIQVSAQEA